MLRRAMLLALLLAGCSKGRDADLPSIGEARSLIAEWALVNEQAAKGRLTQSYVDTMHKQVREQLRQTASELTEPHSDYGHEIQAALGEPDDASPGVLRSRAAALKQQEDSLESA